MRKNNVFMFIVLLIGVLFIGTGCVGSVNSEIAIVEETIEETTALTTEATTVEMGNNPSVSSGLSESEINELVAELDGLSTLILVQSDHATIQKVLDQFVAESQRDIVYLYYGEADNDFWIAPETALPEDYVFSQRPVYQNAVALGLYLPDVYSDALSGRAIHTVAKSILVDGEVVGVIGIDVLGD
jgi:hypothetical protein